MTIGDEVTDFELPDETGAPRTLSTMLEGGPVVLFFYPIASSGGCTQEACHFRDLSDRFAAVGAQPVGISSDDVTKQSIFATSNRLGFRCSPTPGTRSPSPSARGGPGCRAACTPAAGRS